MTLVSAIIPAAGAGKRMGGDRSKQFLEIGGRPIIVETLSRFETCALVDEIILVTPEKEIGFAEALVREHRFSKVKRVVAGGRERQDSIRNGIAAADPQAGIIVIHDGVRPFVTTEIIESTIAAARNCGAALAAVPVKDTVKAASGEKVEKTVPRQNLWLAQTPQTFRAPLIRKAFDAAYERGFIGTDDASLVEALGEEVRLVMGSYTNIKITTPEDLIFAGAILKERQK